MKRFNNIITLTLLIAISTLFNSCKPEPTKEIRRTVLVYMVASNNLGSPSYNFDEKDIAEMEIGMERYNNEDCRLLIYHEDFGSNSTIELKEIVCEDGNAVIKVRKTYSKDISSVSQQRIREVISDMQTIAPAPDYGLVLWSHSTGWIDSNNQTNSGGYSTYSTTKRIDNRKILTRDFGDDDGDKILIPDLVDAIPEGLFSFIYADACYMGGIEIAYQLRNTTNYFIGSPTTLYAAGMPYDDNIPYFFEETPNLKAACESTFNHYQSMNGTLQSNTIVLVDCTKLDALASICREIASNPKEYSISEIQKYTTIDDYRYIFDDKFTIYDMKGYNLAIAQQEYVEEFNAAFSDVVLYCAATKYIFSNQLQIDPEKFHGLSTYILGTGTDAHENYYKTLDWYKSIY